MENRFDMTNADPSNYEGFFKIRFKDKNLQALQVNLPEGFFVKYKDQSVSIKGEPGDYLVIDKENYKYVYTKAYFDFNFEKVNESIVPPYGEKATSDIEPFLESCLNEKEKMTEKEALGNLLKSLEYNEEEVKKGIELANQESFFFKNCKSSYLREAVDLLNPLIDGFKKTGNMHVYSELYVIREKIENFIK